MTESKKILVIQQNQEFAKSHFSFTINLVYILAEAGHEVVGVSINLLEFMRTLIPLLHLR